MADAKDSPSPNPGGALDVDEKALKKGKGRMLAGMIGAGVAAVASLMFYMGSGDDEQYSKFGKSVNGYDQEHFDQFWGCVLQGYDLGRIESDQDLRNQLHRRAENGVGRFGAHVRDACMPMLADFAPKLEALIPPEDMKAPVRDLGDAVRRLRGSWSDYIAYLDGLEGGYEREAASDHMDKIARAWFDYRKVLSDLNKQLKGKLGR